jgi:O-methyltransferase involved in polyketide biosynthesis
MRQMKPQALSLHGVPETMLWTLHARAAEFHLQPALLRDARAASLAERIDCDFDARFGPPNRLFALRAALLDTAVKTWVKRHPNGLVVSLGEGLETQAFRVDNGSLRWLSVDLPEGIAAREIFLPPDGRFKHLAADVTGDAWLDAIDASQGVFFVAQGLFMYLPPALVQSVFCRIAHRFAGAEIAFDVVPRWLSHATLQGHRQSAAFTLPPMYWSLDRHEIAPTLRRWHPGLRAVRFLPYRLPGRVPRFLSVLLDSVLPSRRAVPSLVHAIL